MHYFKHSVALALFAALSLGSLSAQAYEQDKTYKITILLRMHRMLQLR